ncbi:class I SAM-dependent methyltransferase [Radicibacter daui]|uniref:class I SAM-dependent methyltransferase n=1 Tax=Radicibacter daui TaxID=3064829 RepID=UPI004046C42C
MDATQQGYFDANRRNWDERAALHASDGTGFYDIPAFLAGRDDLMAIEAGEVGEVRGLRVAHLQCHFGLDTLRLARRGAEVTGLDFSPVAIAKARELAAEAGLAARFVEGNVYDAPDLMGEAAFDHVYVTWGALNWLPDIAGWARAVARLLAPGGRLYLLESHPTILAFESVEGVIRPWFDFATAAGTPIVQDIATTYTGSTRQLASTRTYEWIHPLSAILGNLMAAGLALDWFHEHERLPYRLFANMEPAAEVGLYKLPEGHPRLPLSFSLQASRR